MLLELIKEHLKTKFDRVYVEDRSYFDHYLVPWMSPAPYSADRVYRIFISGLYCADTLIVLESGNIVRCCHDPRRFSRRVWAKFDATHPEFFRNLEDFIFNG